MKSKRRKVAKSSPQTIEIAIGVKKAALPVTSNINGINPTTVVAVVRRIGRNR